MIFFKIRKNVIYECARFNCRNQLQGETAKQSIMALYSLADNCEYGTMKELASGRHSGRCTVEEITTHEQLNSRKG